MKENTKEKAEGKTQSTYFKGCYTRPCLSSLLRIHNTNTKEGLVLVGFFGQLNRS